MKPIKHAIRWAVFLGVVVVLETQTANAKDCATSNEFQVTSTQTLTGTLQDPGHATLSAIRLELLSGAKIVRGIRTNNEGVYDFGEIPAGKYRIRIDSTGAAFCAPKVQCTPQGCSLEPTLVFNHKKVHPVTVQ